MRLAKIRPPCPDGGAAGARAVSLSRCSSSRRFSSYSLSDSFPQLSVVPAASTRPQHSRLLTLPLSASQSLPSSPFQPTRFLPSLPSSLASSLPSSPASSLPSSLASSLSFSPAASICRVSRRSLRLSSSRSFSQSFSSPRSASFSVSSAFEESEVERASSRFEESFEEAEVGRDEYGAFSDSPSSFVFRVKPGTTGKSESANRKLRRAASYFLPAESPGSLASSPASRGAGRDAPLSPRKRRVSRFSLADLKVEQGPYQKSLWEELKEKEEARQSNKEIRRAREAARILGLGASAALARDRAGDGARGPGRSLQAQDVGERSQREGEGALRRREKDEKRLRYRGIREDEGGRGEVGGGCEESVDASFSQEHVKLLRNEEEERRLLIAMKEDEKAAANACRGDAKDQMQWLAALEERDGVRGGIQALEDARRGGEEERDERDEAETMPEREEMRSVGRRRQRRRGSKARDETGDSGGVNLASGRTSMSEAQPRETHVEELSKKDSPSSLEKDVRLFSDFSASLPSSSSSSPSCSLSSAPLRREQARREREDIDAFNPERMVEEMTKMKKEVWTELSPQQLQTQLAVVRARSVGQILMAVESASQQTPEPSVSVPAGDETMLIDDLSSPSGSPVSPSLLSPSQSAAPALPVAFSAALAPAPGSALASCGASASSEGLLSIHPVTLATAFHKLGRLASPAQVVSVKKDERFLALCEATAAALPRVSVGGKCLLLWGLVRLEHAPRWLPQLLRLCAAAVPHMSVKQLACSLFCVSKLAFPVREGVALQAALVEALKQGPYLSLCLPPPTLSSDSLGSSASSTLEATGSSSSASLDSSSVPASASSLTPSSTAASSSSGVDPFHGGEEGFASRVACPGTLACICGSLARLRVKDQALFVQLGNAVRRVVPAMSGGELALVGWAYGTVGFVDRGLFQDLKRELETRIDGCAAREIVTLAWAFARAGETDQDFFRLTLAPAIRAFVGDLRAKDLALLAWAYGEVGVVDEDFFADLHYAMLPKVKHFTPHDIMLVVPTFAQLGFGSRELLRSLQKQTTKLLPTFSPLQLSRTVYGFGLAATLVADARFFGECADLVQRRLHTFYPQNIVHLLVGLSEAEYLSHPVVPELLERSAKVTPELFAEDCVQLLYVLAKLPADRRSPAALTPLLLQQLKNKVRVFWSLDCAAVCDLLEAVHTLGVADEQLLHMTMRRLSHLIEDASVREFLRTLGCLASLSAANRLLLRTHIHRRQKVQKAISGKLAVLARQSEHGDALHQEGAGRKAGQVTDIQARIVILHACAKLGFHDENVARILDDVHQAVAVEGRLLSLSAFCHLVWALAETNAKIGWTRAVLRYALHRRYSGASESLLQMVDEREAYARNHGLESYVGGELLPLREAECERVEESTEAAERAEETERRDNEIGQALLKLAFAAVVLGEEEFLVPLLEEAVERLRGGLPDEILHAQQVCLHLREFAMPPPRLSAALAEWTETVLSTPRYDVFFESPQKFRLFDRRLRVRDFNYDKWIADPLIEMRIPHKSTFVVSNIYRVSAAFPLEKHLIDVLTFQDLLCPSNCPAGTAELRQRQLSLLGWTVHSVHLRSLYNALAHHNLRYLVASIASSFSEEARQWVTFRGGPALEGERQEERDQERRHSWHPPTEAAQQTEQHRAEACGRHTESESEVFELVDDEACSGSCSGLRDPWGGVKPLGGHSAVAKGMRKTMSRGEVKNLDNRNKDDSLQHASAANKDATDALEEAYRHVVSKA
ncbi:hypothetical protein TGGT1_286410 [Toxoplasma gondii GT1]|uniref:RNA-editing substrate-binding complex 6 protein domain-containing protein n=5 Tax=Toxoplasma gondii TaxID=5811 RepID=S7VWN6_TOXGG|nr:hypothetical protein TGGT1_286410 [Toxoplasma gondii GT1]KAF4643822.1 hypothetical protein TGRH88_025780 [Toxoplasma gondii]